MGKDNQKICGECGHQSSVRRHKEHCRGHFIQFICYCGTHSHSKEVVQKHQIRAKKCNKETLCRVLYAVDKESFSKWKHATGAELSAFPVCRPTKRRQPVTAPSHTERRTTTPPRRQGRPVVGYKQPSITVYNSRVRPEQVPSQLVSKKKRQDPHSLIRNLRKDMEEICDELNGLQHRVTRLERKLRNRMYTLDQLIGEKN